MTPFTPFPGVRGAHLQTIVPAFWPAGAEPAGTDPLDVEVEPGTSVRLLISRPAATPRGTVVLLHGLGGSAAGRYMLRTAREALSRGFTAVRMNLRNCGGTERLSRTLYNAGQSDDLDRVLAACEEHGLPRPYAAVGFSLGGNLALRYAGRAGDAARADAFAGVNPPVDLVRCIEALERPGNRLYHLYFRARLVAQLRAIRRVRDVPGPASRFGAIAGVRAFDEAFTAPDAGHPDAATYYRVASAGPVLSGIRRPSLVLSASDDPFVPLDSFAPWAGGAPQVRFVHPATGGHCGYWGAGMPRFWAGGAVLGFFESVFSGSGSRA